MVNQEALRAYNAYFDTTAIPRTGKAIETPTIDTITEHAEELCSVVDGMVNLIRGHRDIYPHAIVPLSQFMMPEHTPEPIRPLFEDSFYEGAKRHTLAWALTAVKDGIRYHSDWILYHISVQLDHHTGLVLCLEDNGYTKGEIVVKHPGGNLKDITVEFMNMQHPELAKQINSLLVGPSPDRMNARVVLADGLLQSLRQVTLPSEK